MANIIQAFPKGSGGGGGHTILDSSGTAAAQESNLQFTGLSVTDDSANGKTEVAGEGLNAESINDIAEANSTVPAVIIGDANNYSTTEKVVGQWVTGKPLYQRTFILKPPTTAGASQVIGNLPSALISNIQIRDMQTTFNGWASGHVTYNMDRSYPGQESPIWIRTNGEIAAQVTHVLQTDQTNEIYLTIKYTKTVD